MNKAIFAKAEDLSNSSGIKVLVVCDYCGKEIEKTYQKYIKQREYIEKDACRDCFPLKEKDVCNIKYGKDCTLQTDENIIKTKNTLMEKYGVENCMQSPEVLNKFKNTMFNRYGYEFAQQSEVIRGKSKETLQKNFGVDVPIYNKDIKKKVNHFVYVNGIKVSNGQLKIAKLLNGSINTNINGYFADIVLIDDNIIIEYNGSGHRISVILNKISEKEFNEKEKIKIDTHMSTGWKCLIIENPNEKNLNKYRLNEISNLVNDIRSKNTIDSTHYTIL